MADQASRPDAVDPCGCAAGLIAAPVPDPQLVREGNVRLASVACSGWPDDPEALGAALDAALQAQDIDRYGPLTLLFPIPPADDPPASWEVQVGRCVTGLPRAGTEVHAGLRLLVEDYRRLVAVSLPHHGAVRDLPRTWKRLDDHARAQGFKVRPYWRLRLRRRALPDGSLLPQAEASVFVEK